MDSWPRFWEILSAERRPSGRNPGESGIIRNVLVYVLFGETHDGSFANDLEYDREAILSFL